MQQVSPRYPQPNKRVKKEVSGSDRTFDFTNTSVEAIPSPATGRVEYRDARNPSLILRVAASGTKSFCIGRKVAGRFVRVTLGTFKRPGDTIPRMTVDRAVLALRKADGALAEGADVNAEKRAKRTRGRTVAEWLKSYLESKKLKPSTSHDYGRALHEFCEDWLDTPLASLTREKIKARHKSHGAERSEARANNAVRVLRALFNFADVKPNPARNPKKVSGPDGAFLYADRRKRTLIQAHQMPAWWQAVVGLSGQRKSSGHAIASDLLQTLLLTGLRAGEACGLRWAHVDTDAGIIVIPDTKNHADHELPVGARLLEILKRRKDEKSGPYVFGSKEDPKEPYSYDTLRGWLSTVAAESGVRVTAHDLRRTFATVADSVDIAGPTVKQLLNHRTGRSDVTEGYVIRSPERLRRAMQRIEDEVLALASTTAI